LIVLLGRLAPVVMSAIGAPARTDATPNSTEHRPSTAFPELFSRPADQSARMIVLHAGVPTGEFQMTITSVAQPGQLLISEPSLVWGLAKPRHRPQNPPPQQDRVAFVGTSGSFWRLMISGTLMQALTLGLYRFWLFTDMRRYLWSNTVIEGESLEYTGTPIELLLGFLIAIGILIPIYGLIFVGTLEVGMISQFSSLLGLTVFALFRKFASYRARRYRLTRTVLRGVRFHQTGSGLLYAIRAMLWSIANMATLGLAYPWAAANLERCKMRHTFYGVVGGAFAGSGWRLFLRGIPIWLAIVSPIVGSVVFAAKVLDWPGIARAISLGKGTAVLGALLKTANFDLGVEVAVGGIALSIFLLVVLYPALQAIVMRWWLAGLRIGGASVESDLPTRRYYGAYLLYLICVVALAVIVAIAIGTIVKAAKSLGIAVPEGGQGSFAMVLAATGYLAFLFPAWVIYQVMVTFRLWKAAMQSVTIRNLASLDNVQARQASASAVDEGLADALLGAAAI
jgi:uncharacterized membrane protein YjgN (DUF898 family)